MTSTGTPHFLITNDDGVDAEGIAALRRALEPLGRVTTVAPKDHMSATSHSISLYRPVGYRRVAPECYAVDGTPVDSVILALHRILADRPTMVFSGINQGGNLGHNVFYSGTVAAAVEGTFNGIPSVAVSLAALRGTPFGPSATFVRHLARVLLEHGVPRGNTLNVNVPYGKQHHGVRITRRADRGSRRLVLDPEPTPGGEGYWIREKLKLHLVSEDSDHAAIRDGFISVCPLAFDAHDSATAEEMQAWMAKVQTALGSR